MTGRFILYGLLLILVTSSGCQKDDNLTPEVQIPGVWVSTSTDDILDFTDEVTFYKSNKNIHDEPYRHQLEKDSIEIQYVGESLIAVPPTKHKYTISGSRLTIDFSNKTCYGFPQTSISFTKE